MKTATLGLVEQRLSLLLKKAVGAAPAAVGKALQGIGDSIAHLLRVILGVQNNLNSL